METRVEVVIENIIETADTSFQRSIGSRSNRSAFKSC